jgi:hypothetical protein
VRLDGLFEWRQWKRRGCQPFFFFSYRFVGDELVREEFGTAAGGSGRGQDVLAMSVYELG